MIRKTPPPEPVAVWAATLAARFANEIGLPAGTLWESGIACRLVILAHAHDRDTAEMLFASRLGCAAIIKEPRP